MNRNVFIVHGHALEDRDALAGIIHDLGLQPRILANESRNGGTVIEEFERLASLCAFAFILLTPDDKPAQALDQSEKFRARQNVIFEMGWFFRALGRHRTRLVHRGTLELPSDITGVLAIRYQADVVEIRDKIERALWEGGLIVPPELKILGSSAEKISGQ